MPAVAPYADVTLTPPSAAQLSDRPYVLDPGLPRFARLLLVYVIGLAAVATLMPFDFDLAHPHGFDWQSSSTDIALNLAFLFPAGFLLRLSRPYYGWAYCIDALGLGLGISVCLELAQLFLPSRCSSPTDVLTNGLGAWAGACVHAQLAPFLDRRLQKQLSLHLPLANLLYLAVPLLSLDALAAGASYDVWPDLLLACFMALLAAGLYKHRLEGNGRPFANAYATAMGLLVGVGFLPTATRALEVWLLAVVGMGLLTRLMIAVGTRLPSTERRFVPATIQRALPFLFLYLLCLGVRGELPQWLGWNGQGPAPVLGQQQVALALLRDVAAFTLLGYVSSEVRARSSAPTIAILLNVLTVSMVTAFGFVLLERRTEIIESGFSRCGLLAVGSVAGAAIHRAQLRLVRTWSRPPI